MHANAHTRQSLESFIPIFIPINNSCALCSIVELQQLLNQKIILLPKLDRKLISSCFRLWGQDSKHFVLDCIVNSSLGTSAAVFLSNACNLMESGCGSGSANIAARFVARKHWVRYVVEVLGR